MSNLPKQIRLHHLWASKSFWTASFQFLSSTQHTDQSAFFEEKCTFRCKQWRILHKIFLGNLQVLQSQPLVLNMRSVYKMSHQTSITFEACTLEIWFCGRRRFMRAILIRDCGVAVQRDVQRDVVTYCMATRPARKLTYPRSAFRDIRGTSRTSVPGFYVSREIRYTFYATDMRVMPTLLVICKTSAAGGRRVFLWGLGFAVPTPPLRGRRPDQPW